MSRYNTNVVTGLPNSIPLLILLDHHEDKWNRLATSTKRKDIDSDVEVDDIMNSYVNNWNSQGRTSAQDQSLRLLAKRDNELQGYRDRIAKQFDEIKSTKHIPNQYYRFPVSNMGSPVGAAMMGSDYFPQALQAYEEKVRALESEMNNREKDMMKTTEVIRVLIEENNYLRDHIAAKNKDIQKVLDTIGLNDAEVVHQLKHKLNLLSEENNLLANKLEELNALQSNTQKALNKTESELEKVSHEYASVRDNLGSAMAREGSLTTDNQTIDIKYQKANDKIRQLEAALEDARRQADQLANRNAIAQDHLETSKRDIKEIDDKRNFEISEIVQQNMKLKNENAHLAKQLETKNKSLDIAEKDVKKAQRDLESYKLENEEFVQRMNSYKNGISNEAHEKEEAVRKEKAAKLVSKKQDEEIKKLEKTIKQIEKDHDENLEEAEKKHKKDLKKQQKKMNKTIAQLEEASHEKDDKITYLTHQIELLKKQLENHTVEESRIGEHREYASTKSDRLFPVDRSYIAPREVEIREYTPQKEYLSPKRDEIKNVDDRLKNLTDEIAKDIDNAYKKIRDQSPANTATSFNGGRTHSPDNSYVRRDYAAAPVNQFTSSYSTDNLFGSGNKRSPSQERSGHLYQSPENMRKKESYPHRDVQKIVGDILNKDAERGRAQDTNDIFKSSFRPSTKYGNYDTSIYDPKTVTGTGRVVSFGH